MKDALDSLLTIADLAGRADFTIGGLTVSPSTRAVRSPDGDAMVEPRVMQVLVVLAEAAGRVVTRETLFRRCWGGVFVGDDSLNRAIAGIRRIAVGFEIQTIPRTGYRLTAAPASASDVGLDAAVDAGWNSWRLGLPIVDRGPIQQLRDMLALAPGRGDAWGMLALLLRNAAEYAEPAECAALVGECEAAAGRALALDPREGNASAALATLPPLFGDWTATRRRLLANLAVAPVNVPSAHALAILEMATGRPSAAIPIVEALLARDSLAATLHYKRTYHLWTLGALGEMDRVADRAMQLWPRHPAIWCARLWSLTFTERPLAALRQVDDELARPVIPPPALAAMRATIEAVAAAAPADHPLFAEAVRLNLAAAARGPAQSVAAIIHLAGLGAVDAAFEVAHGYLLRRGPVIVGLRRTADDPSITDQHRRVTQCLFIPVAGPLRRDARFLELCQEMGLAAYWRETGLIPDFLAPGD